MNRSAQHHLDGLHKTLQWLRKEEVQCQKKMQEIKEQIGVIEKAVDTKPVKNNPTQEPLTGNLNIECQIQDFQVEEDEKWCTVSQASQKSGRAKPVITRWADEGEIQSNGLSGRSRRVYFPDVLFKNYEKDQRALKKDLKKYGSEIRRIPNKH